MAQLRKDDTQNLQPPDAKVQEHPLFNGSMPVGMISGQNAKFPAQATGHEALGETIRQLGLKAEPRDGRYGEPEKSYMVYGPTREQMYQLGKTFGQESVVYSNGGKHELLYTNGPKAGRYNPSLGYDWFNQEPEDYYTHMPEMGGYLRLNFDWDTLHDSQLAQAHAIDALNTRTQHGQPPQLDGGLAKSDEGKVIPFRRPTEPKYDPVKISNEQMRGAKAGDLLAGQREHQAKIDAMPEPTFAYKAGQTVRIRDPYHGEVPVRIHEAYAVNKVPHYDVVGQTGDGRRFVSQVRHEDILPLMQVMKGEQPVTKSEIARQLAATLRKALSGVMPTVGGGIHVMPHPHAYPWHNEHTSHHMQVASPGVVLVGGAGGLAKSTTGMPHPHMDGSKPPEGTAHLTPPPAPQNDQAAGVGVSTYAKFAMPYGVIDKSSPADLFHYPYQGKANEVNQLLKDHGYSTYYAGGRYGRPDLANRNYNTKHLMIYDPSPGSGGDFGTEEYTDNWRKVHELSHALTYPELNRTYGEGRRIGKLGNHRTLNEALRAVHWEWLAAHKQRELSQQLGIHVPDDVFHKELNTVMHDAIHRAVTGKFTEPSGEGYRPHSHQVPLETALGMVREAAHNLGITGMHDLIKKSEENMADEKTIEPKEWRQSLAKALRDRVDAYSQEMLALRQRELKKSLGGDPALAGPAPEMTPMDMDSCPLCGMPDVPGQCKCLQGPAAPMTKAEGKKPCRGCAGSGKTKNDYVCDKCDGDGEDLPYPERSAKRGPNRSPWNGKLEDGRLPRGQLGGPGSVRKNDVMGDPKQVVKPPMPKAKAMQPAMKKNELCKAHGKAGCVEKNCGSPILDKGEKKITTKPKEPVKTQEGSGGKVTKLKVPGLKKEELVAKAVPALAAPKPSGTGAKPVSALAAPKPVPALAAPKPVPALAAPKPSGTGAKPVPALAAPKPSGTGAKPVSALAAPKLGKEELMAKAGGPRLGGKDTMSQSMTQAASVAGSKPAAPAPKVTLPGMAAQAQRASSFNDFMPAGKFGGGGAGLPKPAAPAGPAKSPALPPAGTAHLKPPPDAPGAAQPKPGAAPKPAGGAALPKPTAPKSPTAPAPSAAPSAKTLGKSERFSMGECLICKKPEHAGSCR